MFTIKEIKKRTQEAEIKLAELTSQSRHLKDQLIISYTRRSLESVHTLLTTGISGDHDKLKLANAITAFLANHWEQINGSVLAYTALPKHIITQLLCDLAVWAAHQLNSKSSHDKKPLNALALLMPTVNTVSCHDDYPDLVYKDEHNGKEDQSDVTSMWLSNVLHTHILGRNGAYLIPIALLTQSDYNPENPLEFHPYFDYEKHDDSLAHLSEEEIRRLLNHSSLTRTIRDTYYQLQSLTNEKSHLLGQLNQLCLGFKRADTYGGSGTEEHAGLGAYQAIIAFNAYYDKLDVTQKDDIPESVREQIDLILGLASDSTVNANATVNTMTCVANRRNTLLVTMRGHEDTLLSISPTSKRKNLLHADAQTSFNNAKRALQTSLEMHKPDETRYMSESGYDGLGINKKLLVEFNIDITLNSDADLVLLHPLSPEEISELCTDISVAQQIMHQLNSIENWIVFSLELSSQQLSAYMSALLDHGLFELIQSPSDFAALIMIQSLEKVETICRALGEQLHRIIQDASRLVTIARPLTAAQFAIICEASKKQLSTIMNSSWKNLERVLQHLSSEHCRVVCEVLKEQLPIMINLGRYFREMLCHLSSEKRTAIFEVMNSKLPAIIKSAYDFESTLEPLNPEQRIIVFKYMEKELPNLIKDSREFNWVLAHLNPEHRTAVYQRINENFPSMIVFGSHIGMILQHLNPEQCRATCEAIKEEIPHAIYSPYHFMRTLEHLNTENRAITYNAIKDRLPKIIKCRDDFISAVSPLNEEETLDANRIMIGYKSLKSRNPSVDTIQSVVSQHGFLLQYVNGLEQANLEVIIAAVTNDPDAYQFIPQYLKDSESIFNCNTDIAGPRFGLPSLESNEAEYNQLQAIFYLQRYIELLKIETSGQRWVKGIISLFQQHRSFTKEKKHLVATKCLSILNRETPQGLTPDELRTMNDGRLRTITARVRETLYPVSTQTEPSL